MAGSLCQGGEHPLRRNHLDIVRQGKALANRRDHPGAIQAEVFAGSPETARGTRRARQLDFVADALAADFHHQVEFRAGRGAIEAELRRQYSVQDPGSFLLPIPWLYLASAALIPVLLLLKQHRDQNLIQL